MTDNDDQIESIRLCPIVRYASALGTVHGPMLQHPDAICLYSLRLRVLRLWFQSLMYQRAFCRGVGASGRRSASGTTPKRFASKGPAGPQDHSKPSGSSKKPTKPVGDGARCGRTSTARSRQAQSDLRDRLPHSGRQEMLNDVR